MIKRISSIAVTLGLFLVSLPLSAQEDTPQPPRAKLFVEQTSELEAVGSWTLLLPTHESFSRTDASLEVPDLLPGKYTFFATPPSGTATHIDLHLGDDIIATSDTPQLTFDLQDTMTVRLVVRYSLAESGKVGVSSDPVGMPYVLRGPDGMTKTGVTPEELSPLPVGNYSVTYTPQGCPEPPAKSGILTVEGRIDFTLKLVCPTFVPVIGESKPTTVTTEIGGTEITFSDVPADAWFGPYVSTVAKRGIMGGYSDKNGKALGLFGPGDPVTLAQLTKIIHGMMKEGVSDVTAAPRSMKARGQWFSAYIASAEERGWLVYLDASADPNRPATRGEVVVTFLQALDIPLHWPKGARFGDVHRNTPYAGAIETAASEGIVSGKNGADGQPTGNFEPLAPVTRAEIAKILIIIREKYQTKDDDISR